MNVDLLDQARALSVSDQLDLVEALWNEIAQRDRIPLPTDAQRAELERRLEDHRAHPDDALPWSEVKAATLAQLKARAER